MPGCPNSAYKINYLATKDLIDLAIKHKVNKLIFSSTCSNYGVSDANQFANEKSKLNPVSLYAETKIDCEEYISSIDNKSLDCVTLRFATAFGVSERTRFDLTINSFTYEAIKKKSLFVFAANTWRPYIHVNDMCNFIFKFIKYNDSKIYPILKKYIMLALIIKILQKNTYLIKLLNIYQNKN